MSLCIASLCLGCFSYNLCDPGRTTSPKAPSGTLSTADTLRVCTQSMTWPISNCTTVPTGVSKDSLTKPPPLTLKHNGSPNVLDTTTTFSLPLPPELLVSSQTGPTANPTVGADYPTWLGGGTSPWNDLPSAPSMKNMTGFTVTPWTPSTMERPTAATTRVNSPP